MRPLRFCSACVTGTGAGGVAGGADPWRGVCDPFGVEALNSNRLEQWLINYCGERLQQLFFRIVGLPEN